MNSKGLVFRVEEEGSKKILVKNPYYNLIQSCLGAYGDKVVTNKKGRGKFSSPSFFVDRNKEMISYANYHAGGLEVYIRIYSLEEDQKSQLAMCVYGNSKRELEIFIEEISQKFEEEIK